MSKVILPSVIGEQNSRHFLDQWESKPKPIVFWLDGFSCAWRQLHVFALISDWLVVLFTPVAIGQSNYFGFGCTTLNWKPLYKWLTFCYFSDPCQMQDSWKLSEGFVAEEGKALLPHRASGR